MATDHNFKVKKGLDVLDGDINLKGTGNLDVYLGTSGSTEAAYISRYNNDFYLMNKDSGDLIFGTNNENKGRFTSTGNFQVGTTTVIDSNRNLTNIGTISSGSITSSGNITAGSGSGFITAGTTSGYVYAKSLRLANAETTDTDFQFAYQMIVDANDVDSDVPSHGNTAGSGPFGVYFLGDNGATTKTLGSGLVKLWHTGHFTKAHIDHFVGLQGGTQNLTAPDISVTGNLDVAQSIRHTGDVDTGINFFADQVVIKTNGTERLNITNSDINIKNTQVFFNSTMGIGASTYAPIEGATDAERNWLNFHRANNASYVEITNRTPGGKVVLSGGLDGGGGEVQRLEIEGGSATKSVKVLASTNLNLSSTSKLTHGSSTIIDASRNIESVGTISTDVAMSSSPYLHHFDVSGTNTVGGGAGIVLQTSTTAGSRTQYGAKIQAVRSSSDDGSADLKFYTSNAFSGNGAHRLVLTLDEDKHAAFTGNVALDGDLSVNNGQLILGTADTSSGHINAYELMTFNIDTDNDDTNRYFKWTTNSSSGSGSQLMYLDESGNLTVSGNFTVQGTTTTLDTATLQVEDKNIVLNYGTGDTSGSADGAGITIQDAVDSSTDATILWGATNDLFNFSHPVKINRTTSGGVLHLQNSANAGHRYDLLIENTNDRDAGMTLKTAGGQYEMWIDSNGDDSLIFSPGDNTTNITMELYQNKNVDIGGTLDVKQGIKFEPNGYDINADTDGNRTLFTFTRSGSASWQIWHTANQDLNFVPNNTAYKLQWNGNDVHYDGANISVGTVASGKQTITSTGTIGSSNISNGYLQITDGTNTLSIDPNEIMSNDTIYLQSSNGEVRFRGLNGGGAKLFNGSTQFMSADRNLLSIGTISSGNITMTGNQLKIISSTDSNLGWMVRDNTYVTDEMDVTATRLGSGNTVTLGLAGQNGINFYASGVNVASFNSAGDATFENQIDVLDGTAEFVISGDSSGNNYLKSSGEIRVRPSGTTINKLVIGSNGNITTAGYISASEQSVFTGNSISGTPNTNAQLVAADSGVAGIAIQTNDGGSSYVWFGDTTDNAVGRIRYNHASDDFTFRAGATNDVFEIDSSGMGKLFELTLKGGSDNLTFTETGGDWSIKNAQQNNGIVIYDGSSGVEIHYNNAVVAEFASAGGMNIASGALKIGGTTRIGASGAGTFSDLTLSDGSPVLTLSDTTNGGGGGAEGIIRFTNTEGDAIAIGYTNNDSSGSDLYISTNAAGTYGGYMGLEAAAISDARADIVLEPKTDVRIATGGLKIGTTDLIDSSRNVKNVASLGVGIAAPVKTLEVNYNSAETNRAETLSGASSGVGVLIHNTNTTGNVYANLDFRARDADGRILYQYDGATNTGDFHFITDSGASPTSRLTIKNNGNIDVPGGRTHLAGQAQIGSLTQANSYGRLQVNQSANNDESGIAILDSTNGRSLRLWADATTSYINSGNGGSGNLVFNEAITVSSGGNLTGVGSITASGTHTFTANDVDFIVQDTTDSVTNYIWRQHSTDKLYLGSQNAVVDLRSALKISGATFADSSRNITAGTISSGAITSTSNLTARTGTFSGQNGTALNVNSGTTNVAAKFESGDSDVWINLKDSNSGTYGALLGHGSDALFKIADNSVSTLMFLSAAGLLDTDGGYSVGQTTVIDSSRNIFLNPLGTATGSGTQFNSPDIRIYASGWDTNNSVARTVGWKIRNVPTASVYPDHDLQFIESDQGSDYVKFQLHGRGSTNHTDPRAATFFGNVQIDAGTGTNAGDGSFTLAGDIRVPVAKKVYFGASDHTYISEDIDDRLRFYTGGIEFMRFTEGATNTINLYRDATFSGTISSGAITVDLSTDSAFVTFERSGSEVGKIFHESGTSRLTMGTGNTGLSFIDSGQDRIIPRLSGGGNANDAIDLGDGASQWRELYLSRGLRVNSQLVIDSSRNIANVGTISSGGITVNDSKIVVDVAAASPGGASTFALELKNTNDTAYTASALAAYNAGTSWDQGDRVSFMASSRPRDSSIYTYMSEGGSSVPVAVERVVQLNSSNTNANGMRQMVFYQYDGAGSANTDMKVPNGSMLTLSYLLSGSIISPYHFKPASLEAPQITSSARVISTKAQHNNGASTNAHFRAGPSGTTDTTGLTSVFLGTSTVDGYGVSLNGARKGTDGTPTFTIRTHSNSVNGSEVLTISNSGLFTVDNDIKTNSRVGIGSVGSTSAPSIYLNTDTDTGIYFPSANQLGLVAGASRKVFIDSSTVDIQNAALKVGGYTLLDSSRNIYLGNSTTLRTDNNRETIADNPILLQTGTDLPWGSVVPQRPIPSIKTYAEAGSVGTNSTNYPDVYGEADLSGITGDVTFTWAEAMQKAQELGGRLPTLEEIMSGSGAGSGQGYDSHLLWTQTPAGRGKYWAVQGSYSGTTNAEITDESTELRIRVFFDTTRDYKPVHYDYQSAIRTNTLRSIGSTLTIDADTTNFDGSVNGTTVNATSTMSITAGSSAELRVKDTTNNAEVVVLAQDSDGWVGTKSNHALKLGTNYNGRLFLAADGSVLRPNGSSDSLDLGSDTHRFNNLYLKGDISASGQTIAAEVGKFDATGTTAAACKLHVGAIQDASSSAIAQFGGFARFGGALILHNGSASGTQTHIEYGGNDIGFTTISGNATGAIRANGYKIGSGGSQVINSSREAFFTNLTLDSSADAALTINEVMQSTPARIHFNMTGSTVVGGGGAILFETSTSGTDAVYNARIEGIRTSSNDGSSQLNFWTTNVSAQTNAVKRMTLTEGGNLIVTGNVTAYGSVSDIRLKENIEVIPDALEKVKKLDGVTFNYKKDGSRSTGLIAQQLQEVLEEAVYETADIETEETHLAIHYGNVVGLLVEAVKEQSAQINAQQEQINQLTNMVNALKEKL